MIYLSAIQTSKVIQIFPDCFVAEFFPDRTKDRFICEVYNIENSMKLVITSIKMQNGQRSRIICYSFWKMS